MDAWPRMRWYGDDVALIGVGLGGALGADDGGNLVGDGDGADLAALASDGRGVAQQRSVAFFPGSSNDRGKTAVPTWAGTAPDHSEPPTR